jgi:hypothetical protein
MEFICTVVTKATVTTISVRVETKEMLRKLGSKGQTYDQIIRELVERASIAELDRRWNLILEEEEFIPLDGL